jgi:hypothetical protein
MSSKDRTGAIAILLIASIFLSGCTTMRNTKVAKYPIGQPERLATITEPGIYKVRWTRHSTDWDDLHPIHGTSRYMPVGTVVGFETQPDGTLVAIAGEERIVLDHLPARATLCLWHRRYEAPTQFSDSANQFLTEFAKATGTVLLVAGVGWLWWIGAVNFDDDCDTGHHHSH